MIWHILHWIFVMHFIPTSIVIIFVFTVAVVTAALEGYFDYKEKDNAPKEEMFWCNKHGAFPKRLCLPLFPHLGGKPANSFICPTCFKNVTFDNPDARLKHG